MRKFLVLALLVALALPIFADDGTVLPAGVFRARVIPTFGWMTGQYDKNGNYTAFSSSTFPTGAVTVPNLGFALEYGINDWITAAAQWAPGLTFASNVPVPAGYPSTLNVNGSFDLFAGAVFQIVGPKAPVVSDVIRFDLAPGVNIPINPVDLTTQTSSPATVMNLDVPAWGFGGRAYLDYVFSPSFFLDLYTQFIDYPSTVDGKYYNALIAGTQIGYGYKLRVELDPHYNIDIADGVNLAFNCAFRYDGTPDLVIAGTTVSDTHTSLFSANPSVSVFLTKTFMPLEFVLDYGQPLAGVNTYSAYSLDLQIEAYFKL